jgi:hypothetical protein
MKKIIRLALAVLLATSGMVIANKSEAQANITVSFSVFHDNLQTHGRWVNHPKYGQIWIYGQAGFIPYRTAGHWVYTQYGWTWVSDYDWGWATFHYGRWAYESNFGWFWVPGYEWSPAWVSWRTGGDYYGWAPLGPGLDISVSVGSAIPAERWVFVPRRYISNPGANHYYVSNTKNVTIIKNTTVINNTNVTKVSNRNVTYFAGPKKEDVERDTKAKVDVMDVRNDSKPGKVVVDNSRKTVNIYKPDIDEKTVNNNQKPENNNNANNNDKTKKPPAKQQNPKPKPKPKPSTENKPNDKKNDR